MDKEKITRFPHSGRHKIKSINASKERKKFYYAQCIYEGCEIEIILSDGKSAVIRREKTKIGLAGEALFEISFVM